MIFDIRIIKLIIYTNNLPHHETESWNKQNSQERSLKNTRPRCSDRSLSKVKVRPRKTY